MRIKCLSLSNNNECLQEQQQQQLYLYPAIPYIDLHDTKKLDKIIYIESVQALTTVQVLTTASLIC